MRILNICAYTWAIGGPARIIYDHTKVAVSLGHKVTILSPVSENDEVYPVPEGAEIVICKRTTPISSFYPEFSLELYTYLKKHINDFDVIHCHGIFHFGSNAPFLIKSKTPIAITIHGLLDKWALRNGHLKKMIFSFLLQKRLLKSANLIQINNRDELADLKQYLGFQHANVAIIPNGMELSEMSNLPAKNIFRTQFGLPSDKKIVLFMGRLNIKKGLDLLLPAFKQYTQNHDDSLLVIAGPDDGYQAEVEQFIKENALQSKIIMVGMLIDDTKKAALSDATIFALPSYSEGFSIAALEAMTAGVPCLVSDRIGFDGTVSQYEAGYEAPLTVSGVAEGLEKLLQNEDYRKKVATNARQMVEKLYDIEIVARQLISEFEKIA